MATQETPSYDGNGAVLLETQPTEFALESYWGISKYLKEFERAIFVHTSRFFTTWSPRLPYQSPGLSPLLENILAVTADIYSWLCHWWLRW